MHISAPVWEMRETVFSVQDKTNLYKQFFRKQNSALGFLPGAGLYSFMKKKKIRTRLAFIAAMLFTLSLVGCKRDAALDTYKENMEEYFSEAARLNGEMNAIDISEAENGEELEAAYSQLLGYMDELNTLTAQMAEYEVPEQFELTESLADEAAENMQSAVELYHRLYEEEEYSEGVADAAFEYYERANKRIEYIRAILQGNIPEELEIVYEDETQEENGNLVPVLTETETSPQDNEETPEDAQ